MASAVQEATAAVPFTAFWSATVDACKHWRTVNGMLQPPKEQPSPKLVAADFIIIIISYERQSNIIVKTSRFFRSVFPGQGQQDI